MPLDPKARALLDQMAAAGGQSLSSLSVEDARQAVLAFPLLGGEPDPVATSKTATFPVQMERSPRASTLLPAGGHFPCWFSSTAAAGLCAISTLTIRFAEVCRAPPNA